MKVICPECSAQFDVPVSLLGTGGRRVRCNNCGHVWMAEATNDEGFGSFHRFDESLDIEPIPSSVHPEDDDGMAHDGDGEGLLSSLNKPYLIRLFIGFALACALAGAFLGVGVALGWNAGPMRALYAPFGLAPTASHDTPLVFEAVSAKAGADAAGQPALQVTGTVRNTRDHAESLPTIEVTAISETGVAGDSVEVKADKDELEAGETITFSTSIPGEQSPKDRIRLRFISE